MRKILPAFVLMLLFVVGSKVLPQSPTASITGIVFDPANKVIPGAEIIVVNDLTRVQYESKTNGEGIYTVVSLPPGPYRIQVSKVDFKTIIKPDIILNVGDALSLNFTLPVGASSVSVTVEGGAPMINTQDASVSTVVDRQFAENLPMNGRSFQTLIYLTPGVVVTTSSYQDSGQFSVNGQRAASNYWTVDGVSANIGVGPVFGGGNGIGGTVGSFSAMGGTNSLVSVDALQEFRIQTSTFAPEFGRTPGGQISIVTRSGTNQFHGTVFDYLRNDAFDANNWFANRAGLAKPRENQNDFGGTLGGPIRKDRTFLFFSYEGLRLLLPETSLTTVPDLAARQNAVPALRPYLNAFPLDRSQPDLGNGVAQFDASYSNPASLDAYSLRVDHHLSAEWSLFGRYNYSPSESIDRGGSASNDALSVLQSSRITTQTGTVGLTGMLTPVLSNDLRFNYSRANASGRDYLDGFGGAVPLPSLPFPGSFTDENAQFALSIYSLQGFAIISGKQAQDIQRQINIVDGLAWQMGLHHLKFGVDYRRLSPTNQPYEYDQSVSFLDVTSSEEGNAFSGVVTSLKPVGFVFNNLGSYAQDTWRVASRLTLTYGLRWDIDYAPSSNPGIPAVTGYSQTDLSHLALAKPGTPPFNTPFGGVAPRIGAAYQISRNPSLQTVLRGGFGIFYDLVSSEAGNLIDLQNLSPPFGSQRTLFNIPFPLSADASAPVPIATEASLSQFTVFNPNLKLPYTLEWNIACEQGLGADQTLSFTYVGAAGRRLLQTSFLSPPQPTLPVPDFEVGGFIDNTASSDYDALQVQFQRRLSHGLQAIASYTWSHSIDNASAGSSGNNSNLAVIGNYNENRGNSDFDIRNAFTGGLTYDIPRPHGNPMITAIARDWSTESFVLVRSAAPVDLTDILFYELNGGLTANIRPDIVPGQPFYLYGSQYPGGKALNPAAFANPPTDPTTGNPLRQGDLPRNFLRGFGAAQWDFAIHRAFPIRESWVLQFRMEIFNLLNHPNFGPPDNKFGAGGFGLSTQMLSQSLTGPGASGSGAFNPLYQIGGPRSMQLALKLVF